MSSARDRRRERRALRDRADEPRGVSSTPIPDAPGTVVPLAVQSLHPDRREAVTWIICLYLCAIVGGYVLMLQPEAAPSGNPFSRDRALFYAVNAGTLTGFQYAQPFGESLHSPTVTLLLTFVGAAASLIVGGMAAVRILRLSFNDLTVAAWSFACCAAATLIGLVILCPAVGGPGTLTRGAAILSGCLRGLSAFSNSGVYTGELPADNSLSMLGVLMPLALLGGLGLPVLMELGRKLLRPGSPLSSHNYMVLVASAAIYVVAFALLFATQMQGRAQIDRVTTKELPAGVQFASQREFGDKVAEDELQLRATDANGSIIYGIRATTPTRTWFDASGNIVPPPQGFADMACRASVAAINSRTAGFSAPGQYLQNFPAVMQWLLVLLMIVGGSPAGTAGGVKSTTFIEFFRGLGRARRGQPSGRAFVIASTWLMIYMAAGLLVFLVLLFTESRHEADRLFFMAISAIGNVGMSYDTLSVTGPSLVVLSGGMLFGRVAPMIILWWMVETAPTSDLLIG